MGISDKWSAGPARVVNVNQAEVDAKAVDGYPPLHFAAPIGQKDVVDLLPANTAKSTPGPKTVGPIAVYRGCGSSRTGRGCLITGPFLDDSNALTLNILGGPMPK